MEGTKRRAANSLGMFDLLKGVGMLTIVFAHTGELYPMGDASHINPLTFCMFAYRESLMAAFYIASGYGFRKRSIGKCIDQQFKTLFKPYIYTGIATTVFHFIIHYSLFGSLHNATYETYKVLGGFALGLPHTATYFGQLFFSYGFLVYLAVILAVAVSLFLSRSRAGLYLRAVGENPAAVATLGINVYRLRMRAVLLGGVFAGMGGAVMCLSSANVFVNDMSAGSGFMAFAANQFGQWSPVGGYLATLLFGVMQALRMRLQSFGIATQLTQMLPYLAALIGIKLTGMRMRAPAANGTPYPHPLSAPCLRRKSAGESQSKGSKA